MYLISSLGQVVLSKSYGEFVGMATSFRYVVKKSLWGALMWTGRNSFLSNDSYFPESGDEALFYYACGGGDMAMIQYMLTQHVVQDTWLANDLDNCLEYAAQNGHTPVVSLLLTLPAYRNMAPSDRADLFQDAIRMANRTGHQQIAAQINSWV